MGETIDPEDSLSASLGRSGRGKLVALVAIAVTASAAALYLTLGGTGSRGEEDRPDAVLVVGPESYDLARWLNGRGFTARQMSYAAAVAAGQQLEPDSEGLVAVEVYADQHGFGYLAVHPPEIHDLAGWVDGDAPATPEGATMAVISVGDLADSPRVTFGIPADAVAHEPPVAQQVGLFLALFEQPTLAKILREEIGAAEIDAYNALGEKDALNRYRRLRDAQRKFETIGAAWDEAVALADAPSSTAPLGGAFEHTDAFPIADGGILSLASVARWQTEDGEIATLVDTGERVARYLSARDVAAGKGAGLAMGTSCGPIDATGIDALRVNGSGDALALRRFLSDGTSSTGARAGHWAIQFIKYAPTQKDCPFALVGHPLQSRQMHELGPPHASGAMLMITDRVRFGFNGRERSWNYPIIGPDGGAAAWVDGTLIAYAGSSRYDEADNHGLAFMSTLTENRLEAFVPLQTLLPGQDPEPLVIEQISSPSVDRFLLTIANRQTLGRFLLSVTFSQPVHTLLLPIDHTGDRPRQLERATIRSRAGLDTRVVLDPLPEMDGGGTLDANGQKLAYVHQGRAMVLNLDASQAARPLSPPNHDVVDVRIAPDGELAIYHRELEVSQETIRTAYVVWLDSQPG